MNDNHVLLLKICKNDTNEKDYTFFSILMINNDLLAGPNHFLFIYGKPYI